MCFLFLEKKLSTIYSAGISYLRKNASLVIKEGKVYNFVLFTKEGGNKRCTVSEIELVEVQLWMLLWSYRFLSVPSRERKGALTP